MSESGVLDPAVPAGGWEVPTDDIVWEGAPHPAGPDSTPTPSGNDIDRLVGLLLRADQSIVAAIRLLRSTRGTGSAERRSGLPVERLLALAAGRTGTDTRFLCRAERVLAHMPHVDAAFVGGRLSWSQVRGIVCAAKPLRVAQQTELDGLLAEEIGDGEPDRIVQRAFGWTDLIVAEDTAQPDLRLEARTFFRIQPDLFGGASYAGYDRLDAVTTILAAASAAADQPVKADDHRVDADGQTVPADLLPATARQAQLAEGLRRVAAAYVGGATGPDAPDRPHHPSPEPQEGAAPPASPRRVASPPRPSISVVIDHTDLPSATGRALVAWHGGPIPLTRLTVDRFICDAQLTTLVTHEGRPAGISDASGPITVRHRRALHAVDRGCRLPGCNAPPQHCDAHHIIPRSRGGPTMLDNLVLLCRSCHSRLHRHDLDIALDRHTRAVTLTLPDGHTYTSLPT